MLSLSYCQQPILNNEFSHVEQVCSPVEALNIMVRQSTARKSDKVIPGGSGCMSQLKVNYWICVSGFSRQDLKFGWKVQYW